MSIKTIHPQFASLLTRSFGVDDILSQYLKQQSLFKDDSPKKWIRKKYVDKRDWKVEKEKYFNRGEFYINPVFIDTWREEIKEMNANKIGQPFVYPTSMIEFAGILHEKSFSYRDLKGSLRALSDRLGPFPVISDSQLCRRVNALDLDFEYECKDKVDVGIDGTGNKVTNRGGWMRHKWKVKKGWVKVVIMGTLDGKTMDIRVGNENLDERKSARGMIRKNKKKIKKVLMDGLHDVEDTFNLCNDLGIDTAIKIRKNASESGLSPRAKEVRLYKEIGHKQWVKEKGYGYRWPSSEGIFSGVKRIFGENLNAKKKKPIYKQAKRKFWAYNKLMGIT